MVDFNHRQEDEQQQNGQEPAESSRFWSFRNRGRTIEGLQEQINGADQQNGHEDLNQPEAEHRPESPEAALLRSMVDAAGQVHEARNRKIAEISNYADDANAAFDVIGQMDTLSDGFVRREMAIGVGPESAASRAEIEAATVLVLKALEAHFNQGPEAADEYIDSDAAQDAWNSLSFGAQVEAARIIENKLYDRLSTLKRYVVIPLKGVIVKAAAEYARDVYERRTNPDFDGFMENIFKEVNDVLNRERFGRRNPREAALENEVTRAVTELSQETTGSMDHLQNELTDNLLKLQDYAQALPESGFKTYVTELLTEIEQVYQAGMAGAPIEERIKYIGEISRVLSEQLSPLYRLVKEKDVSGTVQIAIGHLPIGEGTVATLAPKLREKGKVVGWDIAEARRVIGEKIANLRDVLNQRMGAEVRPLTGNDTLVRAETRVIEITQRLAEANDLMNGMRHIRLEGGDTQVMVDALTQLQQLRKMIPVMDVLKQVANGNVEVILGVGANEINPSTVEALQAQAAELTREQNRPTIEAERAARKILEQFALAQVKRAYGVESDEEAKELLTRGGTYDRVAGQQDQAGERKGLARVHFGIKEKIGRWVSGKEKQAKLFDKLGLTPIEIFGVCYENGEMQLTELGERFAVTLRRLSALTGPEASLQGYEPEHLQRDLATAEILIARSGEATVGQRLKALVREGNLRTLGMELKIEGAQDKMEHVVALLAEGGAVGGALALALFLMKAAGMPIEQQVEHWRVGLEGLMREQGTTVANLAEKLHIAQADLDKVAGSVVDTFSNPDIAKAGLDAMTSTAQDVVKNAQTTLTGAQDALRFMQTDATGHLDALQHLGEVFRNMDIRQLMVAAIPGIVAAEANARLGIVEGFKGRMGNLKNRVRQINVPNITLPRFRR